MAKKMTPQKAGIRRRPMATAEFLMLRDAICAAAPGANYADLLEAERKIVEAIKFFRMSYPYAGKHDDPSANTLSRNSISETRSVLERLNTALHESLAALDALQGNIEAMRLYCSHTKSPAGKSKRAVEPLAKAARDAFLAAKKAPDKTKDFAKAGLAATVARVMSSTLNVKVALTSDRGARSHRGGATYARLLRSVLAAAGDAPPDDLLDIMRQGKLMAELSEDEMADF